MPEISDTASPVGGKRLVQSVCARRGGAWIAAALILIAGGFAWQACSLPLGTVELPGAGFFPLVLSILLAGCCVATSARLARSAEPGEAVELGHRDVLVAIGAMLAVPVLFETLGAFLALGLFSGALLVLVARVRPTRAALASALGMAVLCYAFKILLGVQLPGGPVF
jgi:hypothetical protein